MQSDASDFRRKILHHFAVFSVIVLGILGLRGTFPLYGVQNLGSVARVDGHPVATNGSPHQLQEKSSLSEQQQEIAPRPPRSTWSPRSAKAKQARSPPFRDPEKTCEAFSALQPLVARDFGPIRKHVTSDVVQYLRTWCGGARSLECLHVVLKSNKLYVRSYLPERESRVRSVLMQLHRVVTQFTHKSHKLPDVDIVLDLGDGNVMVLDVAPPGLPVGLQTRRKDLQRGQSGKADHSEPKHEMGFLYPDFTWFAWPESVCPGTVPGTPGRAEVSHSLAGIRRALSSDTNPDFVPLFSQKKDQLFWRGAAMGRLRTAVTENLAAINDKNDAGEPLFDAQLMKWHNNTADGKNIASNCYSLVEHCNYRYLAFLEGKTYSSRLKYMMMCGSVVFRNVGGWTEWWYPLFEQEEAENGPMTVVVEHKEWNDAADKMRELRNDLGQAERMAERAKAFAEKWFVPEAVDCYWFFVLGELGKVTPLNKNLDVFQLTPVEDVLLLEGGDKIRPEKRAAEAPPPPGTTSGSGAGAGENVGTFSPRARTGGNEHTFSPPTPILAPSSTLSFHVSSASLTYLVRICPLILCFVSV